MSFEFEDRLEQYEKENLGLERDGKVRLVKHNKRWKRVFSDEAYLIHHRLNIESLKLYHCGSTSINDIVAKPIIDILVEISKDYCLFDYKEVIVKSGYTCMSETSDRLSFNKGYTEEGFAERVFHLHLRYIGDNDELYFRDYLIEHANIAIEYERMKLKLWKKPTAALPSAWTRKLLCAAFRCLCI